MSPQVLAGLITNLLPDAKLLSVKGVDVTIDSEATGKEIFDAEANFRRQTGVKYEIFMERQQDQNKLRIKLADLRGIKV